MVIELSKYILIRSNIAKLVISRDLPPKAFVLFCLHRYIHMHVPSDVFSNPLCYPTSVIPSIPGHPSFSNVVTGVFSLLFDYRVGQGVPLPAL